ncbi:DinB family protein [Streptomyces sp. CA-111067]|uniref:DinB family protein n=1 Tax=Streptomyces sp. CA-111067 TaxID=3240046 RepID=UPI003D979AB6
MTAPDPKDDLRRYLQYARDALLWKLDGLSEYDVRRPLTPTGTNLLGLVKHASGAELGYLGDTFGRPSGELPQWMGEETEPNADMWATAQETREYIVQRYRNAWAHSAATLDALPLDAVGRVPWWPAGRDEVTLHHAVVRVIADTHRHAGHADILRELLDGTVGMNEGNVGVPDGDAAWWEDYRERLERAAKAAEAASASD